MSPERCNSPAVSVTPARRTPSIEARKTRFLLEAYDLDVRTYLSGAKFLSDSPDVACLIVDYQMPGLNGFDLISELRQRGSRVPAIMITATRSPMVERRAAELGIQQVLQKPLSSRVLLGAIRETLE